MDTREYFRNLRRIEADLERSHPNRQVYVTSIKNSMKNSTPGAVHLAVPYNAARGIADETHRESTPEEIEEFLAHQEHNRLTSQRSEARKKKEIVVVMDRQQVGEELPLHSADLVGAAIDAGRGRSKQKSDDD